MEPLNVEHLKNGCSVQAGASGGGGWWCTQSCASNASSVSSAYSASSAGNASSATRLLVVEVEVVVHPIIKLQPFNSSHLQAAAHLGDGLPGS